MADQREPTAPSPDILVASRRNFILAAVTLALGYPALDAIEAGASAPRSRRAPAAHRRSPAPETALLEAVGVSLLLAAQGVDVTMIQVAEGASVLPMPAQWIVRDPAAVPSPDAARFLRTQGLLLIAQAAAGRARWSGARPSTPSQLPRRP